MKKKVWFTVFIGVVLLSTFSCGVEMNKKVIYSQGRWKVLPSANEKGLLDTRVDLWRNNRLWYVINDGYLLSGFESRLGSHAWQGEHVGKWLHAATLAYEETGDDKLGKKLKETVDRLMATQESNGYLGTYAEKERFYKVPEDKKWDIWSHRYNLYGLLTYEKFHQDETIVKVCERMADLLIDTFGPGKADITRYGTRKGISSMTVLQSVMMLYERTRQPRFLEFAENLVQCSENEPSLRLMSAMLEKKDTSIPGQGKAYQLMANLLGYLLLYQNTGDQKYLTTVLNGWDNITAYHLFVTGGPWSRKMPYNGNSECFAVTQDFDADKAHVETCCTTTWIQLNLRLLEQTGQAQYAAEAERAVFNALMASQHDKGIEWCYFTKTNEFERPFQKKITCCASSGPRALEMFSQHLIGEIDNGISIASLSPCSATLPEKFGNAKIKITGNYPLSPKAGVSFEQASDKKFALEFKEPQNACLKAASLIGENLTISKNNRGFYPINRTWKTGDQINIEFEYLLKSYVETPTDDKKWVAFMYGPWVLSQKIKKGDVLLEPFIDKDIKDPSQLLTHLPSKANDSPKFRINNNDIVLGTYYNTGTKETGVRTYFKF